MNAGLSAAIAAVIGVIFTGCVSYALAWRKSSGKIATTEADTLWKQSNELLTRYKTDLVEARVEATALRVEMIALQAEATNLRTETKALREEAILLREEVARWRDEARALRNALRDKGVLRDAP